MFGQKMLCETFFLDQSQSVNLKHYVKHFTYVDLQVCGVWCLEQLQKGF